jgi:hypothetical protein
MVRPFSVTIGPSALPSLRHLFDARGLTTEHPIEEAPRSSMDELAAWTVEADQVLAFRCHRLSRGTASRAR